MIFREQPLRVIPGTGTITRTDESIIVCSSADMALVQRLCDVADDPTAVARTILASSTPPAAVAVLWGNSLLLFGSIRATIHCSDGSNEISASDAPGGVTHELSNDTTAIVVSTSEWGSDDDTDLQRGTVRGQGFAMGFAHSEPEISTSEPAAAPEVVAPAPIPVEAAADPLPPPPIDDPLPPPPDSSSGNGVESAAPLPSFVIANLAPERSEVPVRQPLPLSGGEEAADQRPVYQQPVTVRGVMSSAGHFNHPFASYCRISGEKLNVGQTWISVEGERPPLGVLNFDDGRSFVVNWDTIAGRQPESDARVQDGSMGPLALVAEQTMSRAHLLIELKEWDVFITDLSVNGVELIHEGIEAGEKLPPGEPMPLLDGDTIVFGRRTCVYHSH
ncbi:MAG: FHA domain-containing protein [Acidimicrobiales bacterium]